jgi:uncharacterized circularly permuted ATP-grasp superfamily protein
VVANVDRVGNFEAYLRSGFCEMTEEGGVARSHYRALHERLGGLDPGDLSSRVSLIESLFQRQGITFAVYGSEEGTERTWPLDLVPRVIPSAEWDHLERGIAQRVTALNLFLEDLYVGEEASLNDGVVPRWLVQSSDGYLPEAKGIEVPLGARCIISGIDIVRDDAGVYRVLEDNLRVPSGVSYVLENRVAMTRVLPVVFAQYRVRAVNHYGASLLRALRAVAPPGAGDPTVVVLTPGVHNSAYFEHAFLARQMGVELVEGRDLVVDDHAVYMRTTHGLDRVDVVYRRLGDEWLDPVQFRQDSLLGVPGLMSAVRAGTVTLANAVGNGVADDKAIYPFVPAMIRYYLGEDPVLPNAVTYLPWEPDQLEHILSRLDQLVVKPVAEAGGYGIVIGPIADDETLDEVRRQLVANPRGYIAQEVVQLSTHPTWVNGGFAPRHIDLRPFTLASDEIEVIPGGLTRVALREGSLIVNSSQGGGSKDTWVLVED